MDRNPVNVYSLKSSNRARILEQIRRHPISRADISRQCGLTKSSVTMLTNEMIREGILYEQGTVNDGLTPGRPSILLDISPTCAYAVGVMLHRRLFRVCLTDLRMNRLSCCSKSTASFNDAEAVVAWIITAIRDVLAQAGVPFEKCVGIGISSPGPIDYLNGVIMTPPYLEMLHHYPLVRKLKEHFDCPIFLENNSVSLAMADFYRRDGELKNTLFVVVSDGIGSALLQDGEVFRGSKGYAGEVGHISINTNGKPCVCGNYGCLEQYATLRSMKTQYGFSDYEDIVDGVLRGDAAAEEVFGKLVRYFGIAFVGCVNLYDIDAIVLFGEYAYRAEQLTSRIESYVRRHSLICKVHPVAVLPSELPATDADVAAAIPAINYFFGQIDR